MIETNNNLGGGLHVYGSCFSLLANAVLVFVLKLTKLGTDCCDTFCNICWLCSDWTRLVVILSSWLVEWQKRSDSYMIPFESIVNCVIMLLYQVVKKFRFWSLRLWVAEFCWARAVQLSTVLYKPPQTSNLWLRLLCEELQVWCKICFVHIPCSQFVSLMKGICFWNLNTAGTTIFICINIKFPSLKTQIVVQDD